MNLLWIAVGGALGSVSRFGLATLITGLLGSAFPIGTVLVNISGSFLIGFLAALAEMKGTLLSRPEMQAFLMIGVCGGYTTFSSFSLQTLQLVQKNQWLAALLNVVLSNAGCLLAVWFGYLCAIGWRK